MPPRRRRYPFDCPTPSDELGAVLLHARRIAEANVRQAIGAPDEVAALLMADMVALEQEHLRVLVLDTRNRLIETVEIYHGSLNSAVVRIGEVLRPAVRLNAAAVIIAHNHPSGDPSPSPEDVAVTRAIVEAGHLLDIEVLDHIIVGRGRYLSLRQAGLWPSP
jgi:DNA repair protein RadC